MKKNSNSRNSDINILKEEIQNTKEILRNLYKYHDDFMRKDFKRLKKGRASSIVIADIIEKSYTCLETLFMRISQFFENNLSKERWHMDLLHKMTLSINGIRIAAISNKTYAVLLEILKFRHFKRYYFELEYDWDKITYLQRQFKKLKPLISKDLQAFSIFLEKLGKL